ncbi:abc transporter g family member 40 [Quercus suber]|uniref:Abc transporter g family member 40 n=1 Tax=Quercus suber TaxID=58331 RepID=A0AAW0KL38_QUESU
MLRNNDMEVFTRSFREEEDDEEALKWAALERLPTYSRMRKGMLTSAEGQAREIDIKSLGILERKALLDRLVKIAEEDNEKFLLKLKDRIDRVGLELPTIEVRFEHLNVEAEVYIGSRALPTIFNFFVNMLEFLGRVTYNGHGMEEFVPQRTSAYISQHDLHIGEMTVRETLAFAARCQGVGQRYEILAELLRREKAANIKPDPDIDIYMKAAALEGLETSIVTDYVIKILGLEVCADTIVGDEMLRGISGGQKKRLTTGEMLVGPARALFMDEISTGLDSSTTFQIVNSLKQSLRILNGTAVISLLQPPPETYELFNDIILLSDGQIVYQGPRENVLEFFEYMGFKCPERKGVADFLQEVTSRKDQEQYWANKDEPYRFVNVDEFAKAFHSFDIGCKLGDKLATPFNKSEGHPAVLTTKKYGVSKKELLRACVSREFLLMRRNSFVYIFKMSQLTLIAFIMMTLFLRTEMHRDTVTDGGIYLGALFFTALVAMFNGISELNMAIMKLPVFYKQRELFFYPSWAYATPTWILKIPINLVESAIWVVMTYYVIGFDPDIRRFFKQYFLILCINVMASGLFRLMAALGRDVIVANTVGSFALLVVQVLGGFIISRDNVPKWWLWGYWISPLMYGQNAIAVNEFLGNSWRHVAPNSSEQLGVLVLKSRGIFPQADWYWIGVGALIGYIFLFNFLFTLALQYLSPFGKPQTVPSKEALTERNANRAGEFIELASRGKSFPEQRAEDQRSVSSKSLSTRVGGIDEAYQNGKRGMVLPFEPLSLAFDEIRYAVDMPQEMKTQGILEDRLELLKGISGAFRPGVLTALMGVSGAGKTTLMDVLAGRKTSGYIQGSITISGYPKKQETFARISGYCEQTDIHSPHVTVYESLLYSAWLRLAPEVDSITRRMFIEEVIELVELTSLREALVGLPNVSGLSTEQRKRLTIAVELVANPSIIFMDEPTSGLDARAAAIVMRTVRNTVDTGRTVMFIEEVIELVELTSLREALVGLPNVSGLSTEQRKRLTIAVELVANPSIIFMDEPTSGLDARAAAIVMRTVRNTVDTGRTVVCTIHQPSIDIFDTFDELLLLKVGGEQIYAGPLGGRSSHLIKYFEEINGVPKIRDGYNPATWMLEVTSMAQETALGVNFTDVYKNSELHR